MSDPVTNVEIEDVLSSIRRLVSNDGRPLKLQGEVAKAPPEPEKLVLTPSLRVDESGSAAPSKNDAHSSGDSAPDTAEADLALNGATSAGDLDSDGSDDDWTDQIDAPQDDEASMPGRAHSEDFDSELRAMDDESGDDDAASEAVDAAPEAISRGTPDRPSDRSDALKARVAELEEVVARQTDQWEPDGPNTGENSGGTVSPLPWEDYMPGDEQPEMEESPVEAAPRDPKNVDDAAQAIEDAIAKAAKRPADEARAPDLDDHDDDIPENFAAPDGVAQESAAKGGSSRQEDDAESEDDTDLLAGSDEFLDEDALRDLVADIVRQELQGALGERITRNVRKLVRREIHRALASQELQ